MSAIAIEQGGIGGDSADSIDRTSDNTVNDALFSIGD
jgi:hypothetical protein